jgi:hypothetical protein
VPSDLAIKEDFHGWPNTYRLSNGLVELRVVTDVGPRVISFRTLDGNDVFYSRERELGGSGEPEWTFRGGWRLWVSPRRRRRLRPRQLPCAARTVALSS